MHGTNRYKLSLSGHAWLAYTALLIAAAAMWLG
jgi:hypothetical protein